MFGEQRGQVLATARKILESGMVLGTWGNVSQRIPSEDLILITPSGMDYLIMEPDDIVLVNKQGEIVKGRFRPSIETSMHLNIYQKRVDCGAIVHVHSPFATAFAAARQNIPVILEETAQVIGHEIQVVPYAHCGSRELAEKVGESFSQKERAVLLANHGLVGIGSSLTDAYQVCRVAERTAMIAIYSHWLGSPYSLEEGDIKALQAGFQNYGQSK